MFAGADSGVHNWSIIATLIQSAKLNEVEPLAWLADVLQRIVSGQTKRNQLHTLLPWNWKAEDEVPILNSAYHLRRDGVAATLTAVVRRLLDDAFPLPNEAERAARVLAFEGADQVFL